MKVNHAGVLLAAFIDISEAIRIPYHVANYTAAVFGTDHDATAFAARLPPPVPQRPAPTAPKELNLPLFNNANDDVWEKAKCKGANFVRAMRGSDRDAGQVFKPPRDSAASEWENFDIGMLT